MSLNKLPNGKPSPEYNCTAICTHSGEKATLQITEWWNEGVKIETIEKSANSYFYDFFDKHDFKLISCIEIVEVNLFKVVVAGGRNFKDYKLCVAVLDQLLSEKSKTHKIVIVSGKASGADTMGEDYAKLRGYEIDDHPADWKNLDVKPCLIRENKYGKYNALAGNNRNIEMAKNSDATVAFWDGMSTGTKDMIELTKKHSGSIRIVRY